MRIFDIGLLILSGIALVGLIVLIAIEKSVEVLLPVLTALIGAVIGRKAEEIMVGVKGLFVKK